MAQDKPASKQAMPAASAVHWGYDGKTGPSRWGQLEQDYRTCARGHAQSPINIHTKDVTASDLGVIRFDYKAGALRIVDTGHTVQVNVDDGSSIQIAGQTYALKQFHFHHPSEERIDGKAYDLVAHLVHANAQGQLAVVAVLFEQRAKDGADNPALQKVWDKLPQKEGDTVMVPNAQFNPSDLLPAKQTYYNFTGSLTTPPCTENVNWFLLTVPVQASRVQVARFGALYQHNNRPTQPLHARRVQMGGQ